MNISGYIAANNWGYDVAKTSQATSSKTFTIPIEEQKETTQKPESNSDINGAKTNPFEASSFDFKDWCSKLDPGYDVQMHTKTEPKRSDEEILKDMAELARKHAQQGTFQEQDEEFLALKKEYISSVSPDREGILNRAVNEIIDRTSQGEDNSYTMSSIYQQVKSQMAIEENEEEKKKEEKEPIDYFIEMLANKGKGKVGSGGTISDIIQNGDYTIVTIDHGGGMTTTLSYDKGEYVGMTMAGNNYSGVQFENGGAGAVNNAMFKDDDGNPIAMYRDRDRGGGLHSLPTKAEIERQKEVLGAYNDAYREYKAYA